MWAFGRYFRLASQPTLGRHAAALPFLPRTSATPPLGRGPQIKQTDDNGQPTPADFTFCLTPTNQALLTDGIGSQLIYSPQRHSMLREVIGLFLRRKDDGHIGDAGAPERRAYDLVWNREMAQLGTDEVVRRLAAVNDYRSGRTGPSGFERWNQRVEREIMKLAYEISERDES